MMTGIMTIFEMAISFNGQQIDSSPPNDLYFGSTAQTADRDLMTLLAAPNLLDSIGKSVGVNRQPLTGLSLCDQLMCRFEPSFQNLCDGGNSYDAILFAQSPAASYRPGLQTTSSSPALIGSCALSSPKSDHRVLISPSVSKELLELERRPYNLYSCSLEDETTCPFEKN